LQRGSCGGRGRRGRGAMPMRTRMQDGVVGTTTTTTMTKADPGPARLEQRLKNVHRIQGRCANGAAPAGRWGSSSCCRFTYIVHTVGTVGTAVHSTTADTTPASIFACSRHNLGAGTTAWLGWQVLSFTFCILCALASSLEHFTSAAGLQVPAT